MFKRKISRRQFLGVGGATVAGFVLSSKFGYMRVLAAPAASGLSDPSMQPKFAYLVPDALSPGFIYQPDKHGRYKVQIGQAMHNSGLVGPDGVEVPTPIWGYGDQKDKVFTWPGRTFQIDSVSNGGAPETEVIWDNALKGVAAHLLPLDTSLHWCYALPGYEKDTIAKNGVPIITHLHGGHTDYQFDGNPEFFFSPSGPKQSVGPQWDFVPGGFTTKFRYDNNVPAGNLWYHDHALGITRLNVYAGLAGFYFVRDSFDTGLPDNPAALPAQPYEKAYAIQDRMFLETGELFYPAYPDDPYYDDFITGEGAELPPELFPDGGPTALAEFFGDHMVVNGLIWPKEDVEPRNYRLHLLNGTDSRFMAIQFVSVPANTTNFAGAGSPIPFYVVGSDQGLAEGATQVDTLLSEPGSRYDIVFDFKGLQGQRIIMKNIGGDEPFGGDIPGTFLYDDTDKIMAFDVKDISNVEDDFNPANISGAYVPIVTPPSPRIRKVALFEGMDEFGRLQPLLGTAELATDWEGNPIKLPDTQPYIDAGLVGQMQGSIAWHSPTTENPELGSTEIWEIYNATGDAHPVHLHLVHFDIIDRQEFTADVVDQAVVQHNGLLGQGFRLENIALGDMVDQPDGYVENAPKDMVTALPDQVTRIKATFDKPGRYVWHCHILSHEDHEMMRVLHVGPGA